VFRWVEHTAELELEIEAPSEAGVFREALAAYAELVGDRDTSGREVEEEIQVQADDAAMLLAEWLGELIYLGETEGFAPERIGFLDLDEGRLLARVAGRVGEPRPLVKAVTLHRLEFRPDDGGWRARVVLDV
jgi:SHS2 domain-containing protein